MLYRVGMPTAERLLIEARNRVATVCVLCAHEIPLGEAQQDHKIARARRPDLAKDPQNLQDVHGVKGCPTCGEKCNQVKGKGDIAKPIRSRSW